MLSALVRTFAIFLVPWFSWKLLRWLLEKSPLDVLPGPPSCSLLFGKISIASSLNQRLEYDAGNIPELYHSEGWDFHRKILEQCAPFRCISDDETLN